MYTKLIKPFFDYTFALFSLIILSPIFFWVITLYIIHKQSPIFFVQKRPGYKCKIFNVYKFATMKNLYDERGELLPDDVRLTNLGKLLRKYSVDEIPQLVNILKGDMSFIGPRPLLVEYLKIYNERHIRRHDIKPGITGWAQINGRNNLSWEEKFELDIQYKNNMSFFNDMKILLLTVLKVFKKEGISKNGYATTNKFTNYE